jgi:cytochrome c oxidase subunit II
MDDSKYGYWLPMDVSTHGAQIDQLIGVIHWFMLLLFVGWGVFFLYCLIKFRARPGHVATYNPPRAYVTKWIEAAVIVFEVVVLFGFSTPVWFRYKNHPPAEKDALVVHLVAEQFAWNFHYAGKDGKFGKQSESLMSGDNPLGMDPDDADGKDDLIAVNNLHIPVNKDVIVQISSKDVIHSFNIPVLRVKQDAIPGSRIPIWFKATQPGHYELACAQLCGLGHYRMRADVFVDTPEDYAKWEKETAPQQEAAPQEPQPTAQHPAQEPK